MTSIPKNNLRERMLKLGYNPDLITIKAPILDNSGIKKEEPPKLNNNFEYNKTNGDCQKPPVFMNIDDWSDFEEDE